jgi:hypothetical protein
MNLSTQKNVDLLLSGKSALKKSEFMTTLLIGTVFSCVSYKKHAIFH